jgi:MFS family permease
VRSSAYRELFRQPALGWQALTGLLAQITQGAWGVGIILVVRGEGRSLALAGSIVGALAIVAGVARPIQGRIIDRRGPGPLLAVCGVVHSAALVGIVGLAHAHAPAIALIAVGALAGAALPPVTSSERAIWGTVVAESERTAAYSLVYLTQQLAILGGPLLLAILIELANASVALIAVAAVACLGSLAFAALLAAVPIEHGTHEADREPSLLRQPGMVLMIGVAAMTGGVIGALEVASPTLATAHHAPAASGLLIAALSVGGIAGALLYGGRRWRMGPSGRLVLLLAALTAILALTIPVDSLVVVGALLLLAGLALNPSLTTISLLVDQYISRASAAEAFGWLSLGISGGTGAANAITAALTRPQHPQTAFVLAAAAAAAATALGVVTYARGASFAAYRRSRSPRGAARRRA